MTRYPLEHHREEVEHVRKFRWRHSIPGVLIGAFIVAGLGWFFLAGNVGHTDKVDVEIRPPTTTAPAK